MHVITIDLNWFKFSYVAGLDFDNMCHGDSRAMTFLYRKYRYTECPGLPGPDTAL